MKNLEQFSEEFKKFFLLRFTYELIKNSGGIVELKKILEDEEKKYPEKTQIKHQPLKGSQAQDTYRFPTALSSLKIVHPTAKLKNELLKLLPPKKVVRLIERFLKVPEPKLPPHLSYLKPAMTNIPVNLGQLNILVADHNVKTIECNGADKNIVVTGTMGVKNTSIILSEDEIMEIVNSFSAASKIPVQEGLVKIAAGRLVLVAIVSEVVGSKFIIRKIALESPRVFRPMM